MERPILPRRMPQKMTVGEKGTFTRTLTEGDTSLFIGATWDVNPFHTDAAFAKQTSFGRRIVPGLLTASLLTHIGGLWNFLATEMQFKFLAPVYIGDTVTAVAEIAAVDERGQVQLDCTVTNTDGVQVLSAKISGYPGQFDA